MAPRIKTYYKTNIMTVGYESVGQNREPRNRLRINDSSSDTYGTAHQWGGWTGQNPCWDNRLPILRNETGPYLLLYQKNKS